MSAAVIRVNHEQLLANARAFEEEAARLDAVLRGLLGQREALSINKQWVGRAADAFYARIDGELLPELRRLIDSLRSGAETTRDIQRELLAAEHEAAQLLRLPEGASGGAAVPMPSRRPEPAQRRSPSPMLTRSAVAVGTQPSPGTRTPADWLLVSPVFGLDIAQAIWEAIPDVF